MTSATPAPQVLGLRYFYGNNILFSPKMERCNLKKSKGWFESSGCEIQRRIKKSFSFTEITDSPIRSEVILLASA